MCLRLMTLIMTMLWVGMKVALKEVKPTSIRLVTDISPIGGRLISRDARVTSCSKMVAKQAYELQQHVGHYAIFLSAFSVSLTGA